MRAAARCVALLAFVAALWVTLRWAPLVRADASSRLVELVAKVTMNEAGDSYDDLALIWQVVEGHGDDDASRARWLEQHSRCVSGVLSQDVAYTRPGRCRWTRNLHPDGRRPRGWDRERDGHWSRTRPLWLAHIERVRAFVRGEDDHRPCAGETPESWDGARWRERTEARGFRVVECQGETRNLGYIRIHRPRHGAVRIEVRHRLRGVLDMDRLAESGGVRPDED